MSMRDATRRSRSPTPARTFPALPRLFVATVLGVGAALLVSCGSTGKGLIPTGNAGPLQSDFEAIARDAQNGNGRCTATEAAIVKTEQDFGALPPTVDAGLRSRLREGITNLRTHALEVCAQPLPQATVTTTAPRTSTTTQTTPTTSTPTQTTPTQTTSTTSTPTTTGPGGTPAPGSEGAPGAGNEPGGARAGEGIGGGGGGGSGAGQEGGK
jgi:cell division septation protein DedD